MARSIAALTLGAILVLGSMFAAMAQNVPGHPGVNQGQIGARGTAGDSTVDARVARQLSQDEARHNGHITQAENRQMNRELNWNSRRIYAQRHQ